MLSLSCKFPHILCLHFYCHSFSLEKRYLTEDLEFKVRELEASREELSNLQRQLQSVSGKLQESKDERLALADRLFQELHVVQCALSEEREKVQLKIKEKEEVAVHVTRLEEQLHSYEDKLYEKEKEICGLRERVDYSDSQMEEVAKASEVTRKENSDLLLKLEKLMQENRVYETESFLLKNKIDSQHKEIMELSTRCELLRSAETTCLVKEKELQDLRSELMEWQRREEIGNNRCKDMLVALSAQERALSSAEAALKDRALLISQLQKTVQELQFNVEVWTDPMREDKRNHERSTIAVGTNTSPVGVVKEGKEARNPLQEVAKIVLPAQRPLEVHDEPSESTPFETGVGAVEQGTGFHCSLCQTCTVSGKMCGGKTACVKGELGERTQETAQQGLECQECGPSLRNGRVHCSSGKIKCGGSVGPLETMTEPVPRTATGTTLHPVTVGPNNTSALKSRAKCPSRATSLPPHLTSGAGGERLRRRVTVRSDEGTQKGTDDGSGSSNGHCQRCAIRHQVSKGDNSVVT